MLAGAAIVLSGDSGPLHMAVALGRPTVSLYGPTDPVLSGPYPGAGQPAVVLRKGIYCSPCYNHYETAECRFGNPVCMIDITPREVFAAVCSVLDPSSGQDRDPRWPAAEQAALGLRSGSGHAGDA